jgi:putative DNA primase/helicase
MISRVCPLTEEAPCWLDGRSGPDPRRLICFRNCLVDVDAYVAGQDFIIESSPHLFTVHALDCDFDVDAEAPYFHQWLKDTFSDDTDKMNLFQEWVGYCMTADMSMEKFMLFQGQPGAGKGTALEVLRAVVGDEQLASTTFGSICTEFGRAPLVGKLVAVMPDARLPRKADSMQALETLLAIVGRAGVTSVSC